MKEQLPLDWHNFQAKSKAPLLYDPPQLDSLKRILCPHVAWYPQTSGLCATFPFCCANIVRHTVNFDAQTVRIRNPDWWLKKMLSFTNKNCPERLRGVWWMEGNQVNQEFCMTFEDADWVDEHNAMKNAWENWARTPTCWGIVNISLNYLRRGQMRISVSPNKKWILMDHYLIYIPDPHEEVRDKDGKLVPRTDHDLIRVDYSPKFDSTGEYTYQYMVRRIAHLDEKGHVVKTENWQMLRERLAVCPTFCVLGDPVKAVEKVANAQVIRWPKRP